MTTFSLQSEIEVLTRKVKAEIDYINGLDAEHKALVKAFMVSDSYVQELQIKDEINLKRSELSRANNRLKKYELTLKQLQEALHSRIERDKNDRADNP